MEAKISAYTTCRNAVRMQYPIKESVTSMLAFADEVIIFDTTDEVPDDGTCALLCELESVDSRVKVYRDSEWDWHSPNHGILDGQAKAKARSLCTGKYLWQFDIDEVVHEDHAKLIRSLANPQTFQQTPLLALPVIEFWGSSGKVRLDINLQKWRFSLNDPSITHGIPETHRKYVDGLLFAEHGTDGCDYINMMTGRPIPCLGVIPNGIQVAQRHAVLGTQGATHILTNWFNDSNTNCPAVFHYSWWDIERKIKQYKEFWTDFWPSLYAESRDERSNPFFPGCTWSEVTGEMIKAKAKELEEGCCGHIFHTPWNGERTHGININMTHPKEIQSWLYR